MADDSLWIVVPNWKRFQHYGDRGPVWIKLYTELNSDDKWLGLSLAERGLLATVWLEFARSSGQVRLENIRRLCGSSARGSHVDALVNAGLIELVASKPPHIALAPRARSQEAETEAEKEKTSLTAVVTPPAPAHNDLEFGLGTESMVSAVRLTSTLRHGDERTGDVITSFVGKLPPAAFETVREKLAEGNGHITNDAGYAVAELQRMVDTNQYAA